MNSFKLYYIISISKYMTAIVMDTKHLTSNKKDLAMLKLLTDFQ